MLHVKLLRPDAVAPKRAHATDAGYDLVASEDVIIPASKCVAVCTGIAVALPDGVYGRIAPRSSLGLKNVLVNGGVIDSGYRNEIKVILSSVSGDYHVQKGDRIAQLILECIQTPDVQVVTDLSDTDRGQRGFGSSGR